jgi:hypothetical protein
MNNYLDLDALVPQSKTVKIGGQVLTVKPPTLRVLVSIAKLEDEIRNATTAEQILAKVKEVLAPIIPELADLENFDVTIGQLKALVEFARDSSIEVNKTVRTYSPKKKAR